MIDDAQNVGIYLRALREHCGWSQSAAQDHSEVSQSYISQIERGAKRPSAHTLRQLARAYGVPTADLLRRAGLLEETESEPVAQAALALLSDAEARQINAAFRFAADAGYLSPDVADGLRPANDLARDDIDERLRCVRQVERDLNMSLFPRKAPSP